MSTYLKFTSRPSKSPVWLAQGAILGVIEDPSDPSRVCFLLPTGHYLPIEEPPIFVFDRLGIPASSWTPREQETLSEQLK